MIAARAFSGRTVAVMGLARSGLAAVRALVAGGSDVIAWDDKDTARKDAEAAGARIVPPADWDWSATAAVILSPGIPFTHPAPHPVVVAAQARNVPVVGDVELFAREMRDARAPVIAITGTNGKSTITALIGHILSACGYDAQVGGNIGHSVLALDPPGAKTVYVIEMSSYQIDLSPGLAPDITILSNITPDHIDRHGTLENYAAVKEGLLRRAKPGGTAVIGVDDDLTAAIFTRLSANGGAQKAAAVPVSVRKILGRGVFAADGILYDAQGQRAARVLDLSEAAHLPGAHNWQNAALAYAATRVLVREPRDIAAAILSFPGLAHRIEDVGHIGKTRFINDSKATNAEAAARALACFPDIFWIAGGKAKDGGIDSLAPFFPRIRKAYLIGDAAQSFAATLGGHVPHEISGTLDAAVRAAALDAARAPAASPVVLLSPACASFDQFRDFEARGDAFKAIVARLAADPVREAS